MEEVSIKSKFFLLFDRLVHRRTAITMMMLGMDGSGGAPRAENFLVQCLIVKVHPCCMEGHVDGVWDSLFWVGGLHHLG